jgi:hypothetical protein
MTRPTATVVAALLLAGATVLGGCSSSHPSPAAPATGFGAWPSFLPSPTTAGTAHGSTADPALSYSGSPVVVDLGGTTVTVDVQGPAYPAGTALNAPQVVATFTVVLTDASAPVALGTAHFDVVDHTGAVHELAPAAGRSIPATVRPGSTTTLELTATVPTGEGMLRYAPDGTGTAAAWDYVAETD